MHSELESGYILHHYPFSETSLRLDLFTQKTGRISLIAKGARRPKSFWRGLLIPFRPILFAWAGRNDLKTLVQAEPNGRSFTLMGPSLWCGLYMNELLMRLLTPYDNQNDIFNCYQATLIQLNGKQSIDEQALRIFERDLLSYLGYGIDFYEANTGMPIAPDVMYEYIPNYGFVSSNELKSKYLIISGASILALALNQFEDATQLKEAKFILKSALQYQLGDKPLKSRQLFKQVQHYF